MYKEIADPVHGLIRLNKVEAELLATKALQRLHNVHQLGLAHLVFPGANYTRHAHSIGACHNAGRMLEAIKRNTNFNLCDVEQDFAKYRIIALLHDVGHYPFSHATEHVIKDYYTAPTSGSSLFVSKNEADPTTPAPKEPLFSDHEKLGAFIIENDPEISAVLKRNNFDPREIAERFRMLQPEYSTLSGVISSDLDCDRLDYLRRTAANSGAPFGSVDINFIIDQATLDDEGNFCFKPKAARAADHLLISRFYDYMQVPFNKTAVALEWSLVECLKELFARKVIDPSSSAMQQRILQGDDWLTFDDQYLFGRFREMRKDSDCSQLLKCHLDSISLRRPAKMLASWDTLRRKHASDAGSKSDFYSQHSKIHNSLREIVREFCDGKGIDFSRFYVWQTKVKFMKDEPDAEIGKSDPSYFAEGVHILDSTTGLANRLFRRPDMLVNTLNESYLSGLRVYYLPSNGGESSVESIRREFLEYAKTRFDNPTLC